MADANKTLVKNISKYLKELFNLQADKADDVDTIEDISRNVTFKGTNLWILIFAIFICSIGLNVNSTAVIIGAMLISPLMGPILGLGLGLGIYDVSLIKKSLLNIGIATAISVLASMLYFLISPLHDAQSELLARTNPTIWDVLIALFGGLAGIVAGSRREKSNAIPGVAIATALMPPLCTAGYGLAIGNMYYFIGAIYLYFINSVFIMVATMLMVRFLKFPKSKFINEVVEKRVKTFIGLFSILIIIPSIYLGYNVVQKSIFERNAVAFVTNEFSFQNSRVISRVVNYDVSPYRIEVSLFGEHIDDDVLDHAKMQMANYNLQGAELVVFQGYEANIDQSVIQNTIRSGVVEELYKQNQEVLQNKDKTIQLLEDELSRLQRPSTISKEIAAELKTLYPTVTEFSMDVTLLTQMDSLRADSVYLTYVKFSRKPTRDQLKQMEDWLKVRTQSDRVKVVYQ